MNENKIRVGLDELTKDELIGTFVSLKLKHSDKKSVLIENVIAREPLDSEIEAFKILLEEKTEPKGEEEFEAPKKPEVTEESKVEEVYIVVHQIKEDGKCFKIASRYDGKFPERFLKHGQIRIKE